MSYIAMNYLAIDTSGKHLTVIANGEKLVVRHLPDCSLSHSVVLMDEIEFALSEAGVSLKDVDVLACAVGPGSFTGIRIGIATIKAFSYAENKRVLPVTSFESLAYNISSKKRKLALISARHGNYYACLFSEKNEPLSSPSFLNEEEIKALIKKEKCVVISDEETPFNSTVADLKAGFYTAVEAKLNEAVEDRELLVPLYVKKSQAEEENGN